jgi:hypothetical protein
MNEINQLVLAGAPDATVLEALGRRTSDSVTEECEGCITRELSVAREGDVTARNYVSCVKVKGRPILPPVMTDELR